MGIIWRKENMVWIFGRLRVTESRQSEAQQVLSRWAAQDGSLSITWAQHLSPHKHCCNASVRTVAKWRQGLTCITGHVHLLVMRCRRDGDLLLVTFLNKSRWRSLEKSHTNHQIIWLRRNSTTAEAQNQRDVMKSAASGVTGHVEERREKDVCGGMEAR